MLRIIVISLFVANLLLFGFQRSNPAVEEEATASPTFKENTNIPTIHLFGEMMEDQDLLAGSRQCFSLGPFHSDKDKDEVRLLLQEVSTRISERQTEALVEKGYWVFLPPYGSLLEANQVLISLQALGLEDVGVIFDGDWKNAISLGYYMRQENAQRRKESVESKGYAPLMRVQRQGEPRYWLDYEQTPGSGLVALNMQNRPNDFMQRSLPCPEEEVVEFAGEDLQEPTQVLAELQVPGDSSEAVAGDDLDTGAGTGSVPQEQLDEAKPENITATGQEGAIETEPESVDSTGQEDAVEIEGDSVDGSGQEDVVATEPESVDGNGQADAIETEPESADGSGQEDAVETEPESNGESVQEDTIETEPESANGTGQEDAVETEPRVPVGTGPQDVIDTEPASSIENGLEDTIDAGQEPADETGPADNGETGTGEQ